MGLVARIFDRSGLEDKGSGGGPPVEVLVGSRHTFSPSVTLVPHALFIPNESADRAGTIGGLSEGSFPVAPTAAVRTGVLSARSGGRDGSIGGLVTFVVVTLGVDLVGKIPMLDLPR